MWTQELVFQHFKQTAPTQTYKHSTNTCQAKPLPLLTPAAANAAGVRTSEREQRKNDADDDDNLSRINQSFSSL